MVNQRCFGNSAKAIEYFFRTKFTKFYRTRSTLEGIIMHLMQYAIKHFKALIFESPK